MLKVDIENLLNPEFIGDDPNVFKFMQVHENEEQQDVSLAKEDKHGVLLLNTRDIKNNKLQENDMFFSGRYHI